MQLSKKLHFILRWHDVYENFFVLIQSEKKSAYVWLLKRPAEPVLQKLEHKRKQNNVSGDYCIK